MSNQPLKNFTPEEIAELEARRFKRESGKESGLTDENILLCELGFMYGYGVIRDILDDKLTTDERDMLLLGGRKVRSMYNYENAKSTGIGVGSAMSQDKKAFEKATEEYRKEMKL